MDEGADGSTLFYGFGSLARFVERDEGDWDGPVLSFAAFIESTGLPVFIVEIEDPELRSSIQGLFAQLFAAPAEVEDFFAGVQGLLPALEEPQLQVQFLDLTADFLDDTEDPEADLEDAFLAGALSGEEDNAARHLLQKDLKGAWFARVIAPVDPQKILGGR